MTLNKLSLKDKELFNRYLGSRLHELSVYTFENIYIWKGIFEIYWAVINGCLCVFFKDNIGCFLYLPPQGAKIKPRIAEDVFGIMDGFNKNKEVSRIENIEAKDVPFYRRLGFDTQAKAPEYLCNRLELARLMGNRFKSKRACFNYFVKHYNFEYLPFSLRHKAACIDLYDSWAESRKAGNQDSLYQGMLKDGRACLRALLKDYAGLNVVGRTVKIGREIKAFTFGFKVSNNIFCVLYEVTDLSVKGLAQFIFREFCRELKGYKYINIMDDSGLENLKKVKLSYQPVKLIPAYIAARRNG